VTMRKAFEQSLADYCEVSVVFIDHPDLIVPDSIRPAPGGLEIVLAGVPANGDDSQTCVDPLDGKTQTLVYGLDMAKPIEDLAVDETGIAATLSFGGLGWHKTFVPWEAVLGLRCEGPRPKAKPQLRSV
jgi:hypothetical protein